MWPFGGGTSPAADSSTPAGAQELPPTARQQRSSRREATRLDSEAEEQLQHLPLPTGPRNIRQNRRPSPQQRIRDISGRRSPSPSPNRTLPTHFNFDMAFQLDQAQLQALIASAVEAATAGNAAGNAAIIQAAISAAASQQTSAHQQLRRPTLPAFDANNVDNWIRRVESAFARLSITDPKVKFANIDEKIEVTSDPILNRLFTGTPTADKWDELIKYLKKKHGKTIKQRAITVIEGTDRDGRTPSQLWALMLDKAGDVSLDDVLKEQLLRRLPSDVRGHLRDKMKGKTGQEVAEMADEYFGPDGKPLDKSSASGINSVQKSSMKQTTSRPTRSPTRSTPPDQSTDQTFTSAFDDNDDANDVNAVRFKNGQKQNFKVRNGGRSQSRGRYSSSGSSNNPRYSDSINNDNNFARGNSSSSSSRPAATKKVASLCFYHDKFGDKARSCVDPCILSSQHKAGNAKAGN